MQSINLYIFPREVFSLVRRGVFTKAKCFNLKKKKTPIRTPRQMYQIQTQKPAINHAHMKSLSIFHQRLRHQQHHAHTPGNSPLALLRSDWCFATRLSLPKGKWKGDATQLVRRGGISLTMAGSFEVLTHRSNTHYVSLSSQDRCISSI